MADGEGCTCHAACDAECCCDADWTPQIVYDQQAEIERLRSEMQDLNVLREHLKVAIEVLEEVAAEYVITPPYLQGHLARLKQTARDYDHKLTKERSDV